MRSTTLSSLSCWTLLGMSACLDLPAVTLNPILKMSHIQICCVMWLIKLLIPYSFWNSDAIYLILKVELHWFPAGTWNLFFVVAYVNDEIVGVDSSWASIIRVAHANALDLRTWSHDSSGVIIFWNDVNITVFFKNAGFCVWVVMLC